MTPPDYPNSSLPTLGPQLFSPDYCIRLRGHELRQIVFDHLLTQQDPSIVPGPGFTGCAGFTEWTARTPRALISLGWDWTSQSDGAISLLRDVAPRSNLMVIDAKGYDMRGDEGTEALWELIESIPWRAEVAAALPADPAHAPRPTFQQ